MLHRDRSGVGRRPYVTMPGRTVRYEFLLAGTLPSAASAVFPELSSAPGPAGGTAMYGPIVDSAHLYGVLDRLQDLGLELLEMRQLPD